MSATRDGEGSRVELYPRLEAERQRRRAQVAALEAAFAAMVEASLDSNSDDEHDPEGATIAFERSQLAAQLAQAQSAAAEADDALARLREGSYGSCATCGGAIGEARLEARPATSLCIKCAAMT